MPPNTLNKQVFQLIESDPFERFLKKCRLFSPVKSDVNSRSDGKIEWNEPKTRDLNKRVASGMLIYNRQQEDC